MELAITGVPGWLTHAFLESMQREPLDGYDAVRALVQRTLRVDGALRNAYPNVGRWIPFELTDPASFASAFDGCSGVVHAAGAIHVRKPKDWYDVNTGGTLALARAAKAAGVRRFVFLSSNAAGGASASAAEVLTEDVPAKPLSIYGWSKWRAEQGLVQLHEPGVFEVAILRPSMFYGPPVPERHIDIYKRIVSGTMPLVGDGRFRRSVTYIDNLVQATRLALVRPQAAGQTYYIVDQEVYTTLSIVEAMAEALGVKPRFLRLPRLVGPVAYELDRLVSAAGWYSAPLHLVGESHWHVAISSAKAMRELGYRPAGTLQDGMNRAIAWCRERGKL
jgi:nucleoside-diphosphate-sugar epimerase